MGKGREPSSHQGLSVKIKTFRIRARGKRGGTAALWPNNEAKEIRKWTVQFPGQTDFSYHLFPPFPLLSIETNPKRNRNFFFFGASSLQGLMRFYGRLLPLSSSHQQLNAITGHEITQRLSELQIESHSLLMAFAFCDSPPPPTTTYALRGRGLIKKERESYM